MYLSFLYLYTRQLIESSRDITLEPTDDDGESLSAKGNVCEVFFVLVTAGNGDDGAVTSPRAVRQMAQCLRLASRSWNSSAEAQYMLCSR